MKGFYIYGPYMAEREKAYKNGNRFLVTSHD